MRAFHLFLKLPILTNDSSKVSVIQPALAYVCMYLGPRPCCPKPELWHHSGALLLQSYVFWSYLVFSILALKHLNKSNSVGKSTVLVRCKNSTFDQTQPYQVGLLAIIVYRQCCFQATNLLRLLGNTPTISRETTRGNFLLNIPQLKLHISFRRTPTRMFA